MHPIYSDSPVISIYVCVRVLLFVFKIEGDFCCALEKSNNMHDNFYSMCIVFVHCA